MLQVLIFVAFGAQDRPAQEWLPVLDAPKNLSHVLTIPEPADSGPKLEIKGRVLNSDGRTPVAGAIVYFHHTDGKGVYPRPAGIRSSDWIYWHGSLRGWLKTDGDGSYWLKTTRPAPYPRGRTPAHIHAYGRLPGARNGVSFQEILFAGDPYLAADQRKGAVRLVEDKDGVLQGSLDLVVQ